ncbi:hypothetical protein O181_065488 [Austropuccinia psidii MF-1]|uniref:Uncharacterized protein n=1 Tax=Austropuccinia psidii MF-1 TaxID=1389203 RepID=A0A9Q3I2N1_9BASI|nr:hypothetical protein [Austropuccinia psidii MF-1]
MHKNLLLVLVSVVVPYISGIATNGWALNRLGSLTPSKYLIRREETTATEPVLPDKNDGDNNTKGDGGKQNVHDHEHEHSQTGKVGPTLPVGKPETELPVDPIHGQQQNALDPNVQEPDGKHKGKGQTHGGHHAHSGNSALKKMNQKLQEMEKKIEDLTKRVEELEGKQTSSTTSANEQTQSNEEKPKENKDPNKPKKADKAASLNVNANPINGSITGDNKPDGQLP